MAADSPTSLADTAPADAAPAGATDGDTTRVAELLAITRAQQQRLQALEQTLLLTIDVFSGLLELRHSGVSGRARHVAALVRRSASRLGWSAESQDDVAIAALLQDIGKIGFPEAMLGKPLSHLTADEIHLYRSHPLDAEAALMPLAALQRAAAIVRNQHERYDGRGFPDGLVGEAIPAGARLLAIVNDHEGLTSGRLAERCHTADEAARTIRQSRGGRYDPAIADAVLHVLAEPEPAPPAGRLLACTAAQAGMVAASDLFGPRGHLLLTAGTVIDARSARLLRAYALRHGMKLSLHVRQERVPPSS